MSHKEMMMMMRKKLGIQDGASCSSTWMQELNEFGLKHVRMKYDVITQHDFKNVLIVWAFQICLTFFVVFRTEVPLDEIYKEQLSPEYGVTRLITQIVMHILIQKEFEQGLNMMKYAVNHTWKFRNTNLAFFAGFLQLSISVIIEVSNIYIVLANGQSQFDIIANFIIMLVIADFDNYFYAVRNIDSVNRLLSDDKFSSIFTWETTTSYDAKAKIKENELRQELVLMKHEMDLRPKYIFLRFGDRSCGNKILFGIYKLL